MPGNKGLITSAPTHQLQTGPVVVPLSPSAQIVTAQSYRRRLSDNYLAVCFLCNHIILFAWDPDKTAHPYKSNTIKPKARINEILICMNYHDLNDKLNCNFHTFGPVIPFGFLLSLFCRLGPAEASCIKDLTKIRGFSIKRCWMAGKALGQMCIWG